jgi:hypothetical protein
VDTAATVGRLLTDQWESGTLYWLLTDHLGSTAITADSSGGKAAELRYSEAPRT